MWRLGALANQFSFVGVDPRLAVTHFSGHTLRRLANGNILIYCNADQTATRSSKVYEYKLDETKKVATLVWSYAPPTNYYAWHYGSAQRLANGNTFIGWGGATIMPGIGGVLNQWIPACTEVTPEGKIVFEMKFTDPRMTSYRAWRLAYPPASQATEVAVQDLTAGPSYDFGATGVSLEILSGGDCNQVTVTREPYAPVDPLFDAKAPRILPLRVKMTASDMDALLAQVNFDAPSLDLTDPAKLTVYYRGQTSGSVFVPQGTQYDPATQQIQVQMAWTARSRESGEFIFGYPDVAEAAYPPILCAAESYRGVQPCEVIGPLPAAPGTTYPVNQERPICLSWSPKGLAGGYHLQIAADKDYANPVVDVPCQKEAFYVWRHAAPGTRYYYRVNTSNDGGTSDWSEGSFETVAPLIAVTAPNGGQTWQRGLEYFIQWKSNTAEPVVLDLYQAGVFLQTIAAAPNTNAYKWEVPLTLKPGSNYTIQIKSSTNASLSDTSDAAFTIN
jgi:hypothetical protein